MAPGISGTGVAARSISSDDIAGVQAVYGVKSAAKPAIFSISGDFDIGQTLMITGENYSASGNEVWFSRVNSNGVAVKVTNVFSTGGGTQISVTVPAGIEDGDIVVKNSGGGHTAFSDVWPLDIGPVAGDPPNLTSISPSTGPAGGFTTVSLTGTGFSGVNSVTFGGVNAISFVLNNGTSIDAVTPPGTLFDVVDVTVVDPEGVTTLSNSYVYSFNPAPAIDTVDPAGGPIEGGTLVSISGTSVVGVTDVTFGGVSGTNLEIVSATSLTVETPASSIGVVDVVAVGTGSDTLVDGFAYFDDGQFINVGPSGLPGILGEPMLGGLGDLTPGSATGFTISLSSTFPSTTCIMFVSLGDELPTPFKGGTLYTIPIILEFAVLADFLGGFQLPGVIPLTMPAGARFTMQFLCLDVFAPGGLGFSASNGLKAIIP